MIKNILKGLYNSFGWKTKRKLIIITSDDWGSVRVPSKEARDKMIASGLKMDNGRFNRYDTLESAEDMSGLFKVLSSHKDSKGNPAVFTALTNVANPDFDKIRESDFKEYFYEPFTETLKKYPSGSGVYDLYKKGIAENIFVPEFHGREHVNVSRWMSALQSGHEKTRIAFDNDFYMPDTSDLAGLSIKKFGSAFDVDKISDVDAHRVIVKEGIEMFRSLFGYSPTLFTAPVLTYNTKLEQALKDEDIKLIDVPLMQKIPMGAGEFKKQYNYIGKKNKLEQTYIIRNGVFEPNMSDTTTGIDTTLNEIALAFRSGKPAIISNHRAAFTGSIDPANRDRGLKALDELLTAIMNKWPDAEFISARDLYKIMSNDR